MSNKLENFFKNVVLEVSKCSTCCRVKVGALLVRDGRIVATGWNGVPKGKTHCEDIFKEEYEKYKNCLVTKTDEKCDIYINDFKTKHGEFSKINELHAEQNLISYCARNGIITEGTTLYVTSSPCSDCSKLIIASGIKEVCYLELYDREIYGLKILEENGIVIRKFGE